MQEWTEKSMQRNNITAADYAVLLSNLNGTGGDDKKLEDFGRHYGDVVRAFHIRTVGRVLVKCNAVRRSSPSWLKMVFAMTLAPSRNMQLHPELAHHCLLAVWTVLCIIYVSLLRRARRNYGPCEHDCVMSNITSRQSVASHAHCAMCGR